MPSARLLVEDENPVISCSSRPRQDTARRYLSLYLPRVEVPLDRIPVADGQAGFVLDSRRLSLGTSFASGSSSRENAGYIYRAVLGLLCLVARLLNRPDRGGNKEIVAAVRRVVCNSDWLRCVGRPDCEDVSEKRRVADGVFDTDSPHHNNESKLGARVSARRHPPQAPRAR